MIKKIKKLHKFVFIVLTAFLVCSQAVFLFLNPVLAASISTIADSEGVHLNWEFTDQTAGDTFYVLKSSQPDPNYPADQYTEAQNVSENSYLWDQTLLVPGEINYFRVCMWTGDECVYSETKMVTIYRLSINMEQLPNSINDSVYITAETNGPVDMISFRVRNEATQMETNYTGEDLGNNRYRFFWDIGSLADGQYTIIAYAYKSPGNEATEDAIAHVEHSPVEIDYRIEYIDQPVGNLSGVSELKVKTNIHTELSYINIIISGQQNGALTPYLIDSSNNIYGFEWDTVNYPNGDYTLEVIGKIKQEKATSSANDIINVSVYNESDVPDSIPHDIEDVSIAISSDQGTQISGDAILRADTNQQVDQLSFIMHDPNNVFSNAIYDAQYQGFFSDTNTYRYEVAWPADYLNNGEYQIYAHYQLGGENKDSNSYVFNIVNLPEISQEAEANEENIETEENTVIENSELNIVSETTDDVGQNMYIEFIQFPKVIDQSAKIVLRSNFEQSQIRIKLVKPQVQKFNIVHASRDEYYFIWPVDPNFSAGPYEIEARGYDGTIEKTTYIYGEIRHEKINNQEPAGADTFKKPIDNVSDSAVTPHQHHPVAEANNNQELDQEEEKSLSDIVIDECKDKGIFDAVKCRIFMNLEKTCQDNAIVSRAECDNFLALSYECREQKIKDKKECEQYLFNKALLQECRDKDINEQNKCWEYYLAKNYIPTCSIEETASSSDCIDANNSGQEQQTICRQVGISDFAKCQEYIKKTLPQECQDLGIYSKKQCDKFVYEKYRFDICKEAGINNSTECQGYLFNKYSQRIDCDGEEQCNVFMKENKGAIISKQFYFDQIKNSILEEKKSATIGEIKNSLQKKGVETNNFLPIKEESVNVSTVKTKREIAFQNNKLIQTSPLALVLDSDKDGLNNDLEKRLGTDPYKADTDGDGYSDYAEIKNGYNPLGEGFLEKNKLSAVDKAMLNNKELEHPKNSGSINKELNIKQAYNNIVEENNQEEEYKGYILSGQAEANTILTIYLYSDLPMISTVETDANGNWQYEFSNSLVDGEHEVYIALNDESGKILAKSNPFYLFVKEAKAVDVNDFISIGAGQKVSVTDSQINIYIILAAFITLIAIVLFVIFLSHHNKKKNIA